MFSTPAPIPTLIYPDAIALDMFAMACRPKLHCQFTIESGTVCGMPAESCAMRIAAAPDAGDRIWNMLRVNMSKVPPPDVDWEVMRACREAMDCLIPMGMTGENVAEKYGYQAVHHLPSRSHYLPVHVWSGHL